MDDTSQLTNLESGPTITPNGRQLVTEMMLTDRELPAVQSFLKLVARRMPSFSFAASAEFNHFIRTVIHEAQRYPTLPPRLIFPHLTYRRIKAIITRASLRQKKNRKLLWRNATIGITFDGGKIGHKKYTVVCGRRIDCHDKPIYWKIHKECRNKDDFKVFYIALQKELQSIGATVGTVTIDGEAAQRFAMKELFSTGEYLSCFPGVLLKPIHVYCCNHLANLAVQDSIQKIPLLREVHEKILSFVSKAHRTDITELLGAACPTYASHRWLGLKKVCEFIRWRRLKIIENNLLATSDVANIILFELLIFPMYQLQLVLESNERSLGDVFPALFAVFGQLNQLSHHPAFDSAEWLYSIREFMRNIYNRFFSGTRGNRLALAFACTPTGMNIFRDRNLPLLFSWTPDAVPCFSVASASTGPRRLSIANLNVSYRKATQPSVPVAPLNGELFKRGIPEERMGSSFSDLMTLLPSISAPLQARLPFVKASPIVEDESSSNTSDNSSTDTNSEERRLKKAEAIRRKRKIHIQPKESAPSLSTPPSQNNTSKAPVQSPQPVPKVSVNSTPSGKQQGRNLAQNTNPISALPITQGVTIQPQPVIPPRSDASLPPIPQLQFVSALSAPVISNVRQANTTQHPQLHVTPHAIQPTLHGILQRNAGRPIHETEESEDKSDSISSTLSSSASLSSFSEDVSSSPASAQPSSSTSEDIDDEVVEVASSSSFPSEDFLSTDREKEIIQTIMNRINQDWIPNLTSAFDQFLSDILTPLTTQYAEQLKLYFAQSLASYQPRIVIQDPLLYYETIQGASFITDLYSVICNILSGCPCSEAQCERMFSRMRLLVGERRYSLTFRRLDELLSLL